MSETDGVDYDAQAERLFQHVRESGPLIHHITNLVVTNDTANLTIGLGASPVMAYAPEEVGEMAGLAQALLLNIGTLSVVEVEAMLIAGRAANAAAVPVVLDPVGAGATRFRTETALRLLDELDIAVLRGNRGEIGALVGGGTMRGVDAVGIEDPESVARAAFARFGVTTAVTGPIDVIIGPDAIFRVATGHRSSAGSPARAAWRRPPSRLPSPARRPRRLPSMRCRSPSAWRPTGSRPNAPPWAIRPPEPSGCGCWTRRPASPTPASVVCG